MGKRELLILFISAIVWIWTIKRPLVGLAYFLIFTSLLWQEIYEALQPFHIPKITAIMTILSWLVFNRSSIKFNNTQTKLLILFFIVMCVSRFNANLEMFGGKYMPYFWKIVIVYFLIVNLIDTREKLKIFIWLLVIAASTLAFVSIYKGTNVPYWVWIDRNYFGLMYVAIIAFSGVLFLNGKSLIKRSEALFYFILLFFAIANGLSRGGYIGLGMVFFLLAFSNLRIKKLAYIVPVFFLLISFVSENAWQRFQTIKSYKEEPTAVHRLEAWKVGARMMSTYPFLGVGVGEFAHEYSNYSDMQIGVEINAHNMFVQAGAETGLIGLSIFILIVLVSLKDVMRIRKVDKMLGESLGIALVGFLISGIFLSAAYHILLYILFGLIVAARNMTEKETPVVEGPERSANPIILERYEVLFRSLVFIVCVYLGLY